MTTSLDLTDDARMCRFCFHVGALNRACNGQKGDGAAVAYRSSADAAQTLRVALLGSVVDPHLLPPAHREALRAWTPSVTQVSAYHAGFRAGLPVIGSDADREAHVRAVLLEELPAVERALGDALSALRRATMFADALSWGLPTQELDWFTPLARAALAALTAIHAKTEKAVKALEAKPARAPRAPREKPAQNLPEPEPTE